MVTPWRAMNIRAFKIKKFERRIIKLKRKAQEQYGRKRDRWLSGAFATSDIISSSNSLAVLVSFATCYPSRPEDIRHTILAPSIRTPANRE